MKDEVLDRAPATGAQFERDTEVARLVGVLAHVYDRIDDDIDTMMDSRSIETAAGDELDLKALEFDTVRPQGESDSTFRLRVKAARTSLKSETTFEEFAEGCLQFLGANPSDIELIVDYTDELGAVIVLVDSRVIDNSPFSEPTIVNLMETMIPMDRRVVLRAQDGFQFSDSSTTGQKSGEGFGQGEWTE